MESLQEVANALSKGTPYGLFFPKDTQPQPKTAIAIISRTGLEIWPMHSQGPSEQKSIKILEKRERGRIQGLPKFFDTPVISLQERVKLPTLNCVRTFIGSIGTKAHYKFREKQPWAYTGTLSRGHLCDSSAFLLTLIN